MNSAALLDLLGNENRRRILRLLARRPYYVTEMSDYLGVSPKALIDHLRKLEEAGLVESRVDDRRRKYFHIARNLRLEVSVSPYRFGTKSAYPARGLDIAACRHVSVDAEVTDDGHAGDVSALVDRLQRLEELEEELSMAQRWVQGRLTETLDDLSETVAGEDVDSRLYADVLLALREGATTTAEIADAAGMAPEFVEDALATMTDAGLVERTSEGWQLR
jgi:ArsR family transcriptional regulator